MKAELGYLPFPAALHHVLAARLGGSFGLRQLLTIENSIFTEWRLRFYGRGVAVALVIAILFGWVRRLGHWVVEPDGKLGNIDFCWMWVSGKFAAMRYPMQIYDRVIYAAAQHIFYRSGECQFMHQYVYPPTYLFFTYPLGLMPYLTAYAVWVGMTFVVYAAAIYAVVPRSVALIAALASAPVLKNIELGHNGFLFAGLIGLSLFCLRRRPWLSGILLGFLTCKPQFGVLFPPALLISHNWRALASAAAMSGVLATAAALTFGDATWPAFFASLIDRTSDLSPQAGVELVLESFYGLTRWAGAAAWLAWSIHLTVALSVWVVVTVVWGNRIAYPLKAATLCLGSLLTSPYLLPYDLCILPIAVAFLVQDGLSRGFLAGERVSMMVCFVTLYCPLAPVGPIICLVLLLLVLRRIWKIREDAASATPEPACEGPLIASHAHE
jgi:Glycosyltransferase family 87